MGIKISDSERTRRLTHVENWYKSGQSMSFYSKAHNLNYNNFKQWCYKWRQSNGKSIKIKNGSTNNFIPIEIQSTKPEVIPVTKNRLYRFEFKLLYGLIDLKFG